MIYDRKYARSQRVENPLKTARWLSFVTFAYTIPIFRKGRRREINEYDLSQPLDEHKASTLGRQIALDWTEERRRAKQQNYRPSLTTVLFKMFSREIFCQGLCLFITEVPIRFFQPLFLGLLVRYFSSDNQNSTEPLRNPTYMMRVFHYWSKQSPIQLEEAYVYASGVLLCSLAYVAIVNPCMMDAIHTGMKMRVAACSLIYRKILRLDLTALAGSNVGSIATLLSNDLSRFDMLLLCCHYLWIAPLQLLLCLLMLYQQVGAAAVFGISVMTAFIPLQAWFGNRTSRYRLATAHKTDERLRQMNEILQGMQIIKMYTWEYVFAKQIYNLRSSEIKMITETSFIRGAYMSLLMFTARLSLFATVLVCLLRQIEITADGVFYVWTFYQILRQTVSSLFPFAIAQIVEAHMAVTRIKRLLMMPEAAVGDRRVLEPNYKPPPKSGTYDIEAPRIVLKNASVAVNNQVCIQNVSFVVDKPHLIAVIGPAGSGKSSLLNAILGEMQLWVGSVEVSGTMSYASQEPWLFTGSVRQNILFGQEYDKIWYNKVVEACALTADFRMLPFSDYTPVGESVLPLSGGQRARINLARALYKRSDIYLLDDPLSAVDSDVGRHLFETCIRKFLNDKIVILVTNQLHFISHADKVIIMDKGAILVEGTYEFLEKNSLDFAEFLRNQLTADEGKPEFIFPSESSVHSVIKDLRLVGAMSLNVINIEREVSKLSVGEKQAHGFVGRRIIRRYFRAGSSWCSIICVFALFVGAQFLASVGDLFLAEWISLEEVRARNGNETELTLSCLDRNSSILIYTIVISSAIVVSLVRSFYFFVVCMRAAVNLHDSMFQSIITASMKFFDSTSSGQILNRFFRDLATIDDLLPNAMLDAFQIIMTLIGVLCVIMAINYYLAPVTIFICLIFYFLRSCYVKTSRYTKRLENIARSPVYTHLKSSIYGLATIRSNAAGMLLTEEFDTLLDDHSSSWFMFVSTARAFGHWIDLICVLYIGTVAYSFFLVANTASRVGLAITTAIGLTGVLQWGIKQSAEMRNQMISVERVLEYTRIEHEPDLESQPDKKPPEEWPTDGKIEFRNLSLRYNLDAPVVLKNLNFLINPQEKIGIVGRRGAGKSSMIATLFRLAYFEGTVLIDGVDISEIGLHDLRRKISIIPKDPVFFSGTLRYNIDPFGLYDDDEIMRALIVVESTIALRIGYDSLYHHVLQGGVNINVGERQLLCLARTLLRNNRILILDEATANVDSKTDKSIQTTLRQKFKECTVLKIAHRLHTVMDYDRILVIDAGKVVEFDHPHNLLKKKYGYFTDMVEKTGKAMANNLKELAKQNYQLKYGQS